MIKDPEFAAKCTNLETPESIFALKVQQKMEQDEIEVLKLLRDCDSQFIVKFYFFAKFTVTKDSVMNTGSDFNGLNDLLQFKSYDAIKVWGIGMEVIEGKILESFQNKNDDNNLFKLILQVASGLEWLHFRGIMHRDIKPSNIIINRKFTIVNFTLFLFFAILRPK